MKSKYKSILCCLVLFIFCSQIALAEDMDELFEDYDQPSVQSLPDPLYYFNKGMYHFNDKVYFWFLKPVAKGYSKVVPKTARLGIKNFFYNLAYPIRLTNNLLQFKFKEATEETGIFLFNTIYGLGFMRNAQNSFGWENSGEDFGQTLGFYSITGGIYLVLPFFGPSNLRDTVGIAGDSFLSPFNLVDPWAGVAASGHSIVNETSLNLGVYERIKENSIDPYAALKDGYEKIRAKKIAE